MAEQNQNQDMQKPHKRRVRYKGTHPRTFEEKYKEREPEKYAETIEKVISKGSTPAGMHLSICVDEILEFLQIQPGQRGLDATLGYGGHSRRMLEKLEGSGHLYGLDVDPIEIVKTTARLREKGFGEEILTVRQMNFAEIDLLSEEVGKFDFVLADLGVSSMQIDNPERGFTYKAEGPLDLRLDPEKGVSAADRLKEVTREELTGMLAENFHADRALSCNDIGIVERMDEGQMPFFFQFLGVVAGIGERIAIQYDFDIVAAMCADGLYLDGRGGGRHGDDGPAVKSSGGQCDALGMVACRSADHAFFQLVGRKVCHFVICAAQFETEYALHVLALEQDMVAGTPGEIRCLFERGFDGDIVNTCRKDFFQIIGHDDTGQRL